MGDTRRTKAKRRLSGVLCIPFQSDDRPHGEAEKLESLRKWIIESAKTAGICLSEVKGSYDSSEQVITRIYRQIKEADIVVSVVREQNPNVFYEAGYAFGWGKPILWVARDDEKIPFDIAGIERFIYNELASDEGKRLSECMKRCAETGPAARSAALMKARQHVIDTDFAQGLFGECIDHIISKTANWIGSWGPSQFEIEGAEAVTEIGAFILTKLKEDGFATQYYPGQRSWQHSHDKELPDYFEAARKAVGRGVAITRVYVLDSREQLDEQALRSRIWADVAAGITVLYILKRDVVDPEEAQDFGLWDNSLLGQVEYSYQHDEAPRLRGCRYYADEHHLNSARKWRDSILERAKPCPDLPSERLLLTESSQLRSQSQIYDAADGAAHCRERKTGKDDCSHYHLPWQNLRLCEMVSTPSWHGDFYRDELRDWSQAMDHESRRCRLLITGVADYGMLYWVAQSIPHDLRRRSEFHVLDICNTPLEGCRWLEKRLKGCEPPLELDLHLHHQDVMDNDLESGTFDLIATDAFLTRFTTFTQKRRLMHEWVRLLGPKGWIVTTTRVRQRRSDICTGDRRRFIETATACAKNARLDVDKIVEEATAYANHIKSTPFKDEADIKRLFEGLEDAVEWKMSFAQLQEREMVPAKYARISARRRT